MPLLFTTSRPTLLGRELSGLSSSETTAKASVCAMPTYAKYMLRTSSASLPAPPTIIANITAEKQMQRVFSLTIFSNFSSIMTRCSCNASDVQSLRICGCSLAFCERRTIASHFTAPAAKPRRAEAMARRGSLFNHHEKNNHFFGKSAGADILHLISKTDITKLRQTGK